jgi:hypothetical protein
MDEEVVEGGGPSGTRKWLTVRGRQENGRHDRAGWIKARLRL